MPNQRPLLAATLLFVLLAAVVAGCGGGDSQPTTVETSSLTKSQFIKKAEAICVNVRKEMGEELQALGTKTERETLEAGEQSILIPGVETHREKISELGAPRGDEAKVEALLEAMQEAADDAAENPAKSFKQFSESFTRFDRMAADFGMEGCQFD